MGTLARRHWPAAHDGAPAAALGFSLIELLSVLAIMSLLLALAVPAYHGHVVRAKRVQGQATLLRLMQQQERYYSQNNHYLAFSSASPAPQVQAFPWWSGEGPAASAAASAYEIEALACSGSTIGQCVLLRAMPGTSKVDAQFQDADCGVLSLSSTGQRGSSGPASRCWP
ncbi:type IV pilin protein [Janthinobacterium sp. 78]|uniref:type IV pilin protein n=1 Tax=Janthinobacterium sp. 78 TaxID=2135631 RepID=UPI000D5DEE6C|nr:type IV pilin protein [Janthinobacterium sp. 78]PVX35287.1 type IV pilus assembly protein PilE [Janthinobacterium sp. 78]